MAPSYRQHPDARRILRGMGNTGNTQRFLSRRRCAKCAVGTLVPGSHVVLIAHPSYRPFDTLGILARTSSEILNLYDSSKRSLAGVTVLAIAIIPLP